MKLIDIPFPFPPSQSLPFEKSLAPIHLNAGYQCRHSRIGGDWDRLSCSLTPRGEGAQASEAVRASIAMVKQKVDQAALLVRERYAWRGYTTHEEEDAYDSGNRRVLTLIAEAGSATVGTMTLGLDGPGGLSVGESYPDEISAARSEGRRLCELTRLAVAQQVETKTVLGTLFDLGYRVFEMHGATDVFIEVNPRHVGFYRRMLGFVVAAGERLCERVQAPAVLLQVSMDELGERLQAYIGNRSVNGAGA